jgi:hypothetical protein
MSKCQFPDGISVHIGDAVIDPCQYKLAEIHKNVTVEVLKCPKCGAVSIGWHRQEDTEDILIGEPESEDSVPTLEDDGHDISGLTEEE